jgi:hypothetical protein
VNEYYGLLVVVVVVVVVVVLVVEYVSSIVHAPIFLGFES